MAAEETLRDGPQKSNRKIKYHFSNISLSAVTLGEISTDMLYSIITFVFGCIPV